MPNDHVQTLIELLRPAGPDLARRLVSALLLAPAEEREEIVSAIEQRMVELYANDDEPRREVDVLESEVQREGYVEQVFRTYETKPETETARRAGKEKRKGAGS